MPRSKESSLGEVATHGSCGNIWPWEGSQLHGARQGVAATAVPLGLLGQETRGGKRCWEAQQSGRGRVSGGSPEAGQHSVWYSFI